jgi:hypothetical protein
MRPKRGLIARGCNSSQESPQTQSVLKALHRSFIVHRILRCDLPVLGVGAMDDWMKLCGNVHSDLQTLIQASQATAQSARCVLDNQMPQFQVFNELIKAYIDSQDTDSTVLRQPASGLLSGLLRLLGALLPQVRNTCTAEAPAGTCTGRCSTRPVCLPGDQAMVAAMSLMLCAQRALAPTICYFHVHPFHSSQACKPSTCMFAR